MLAVLLVAVAALAAGNLFGGGAHAHPNPEGSYEDTGADHAGHVLTDYVRENDPEFIAVMHQNGTYNWELLWENATSVSDSDHEGEFTWPPDSGLWVNFETGFPADDISGTPIHLDTTFIIRVTDGDTTAAESSFVTEVQDGFANQRLPNVELIPGRTNVTVIFTNFKYAGPHSAEGTYGGFDVIDTATVNSTGLLSGANVTLSGFEPYTLYGVTTRPVDVNLVRFPFTPTFRTLPPLLAPVNDTADLPGAIGHVDIPVLDNDIVDPEGIRLRVNIVRDGSIGNATVINGTIIRYEANDPFTAATDTFAYSMVAPPAREESLEATSEPANVTVSIIPPALEAITDHAIIEPGGSSAAVDVLDNDIFNPPLAEGVEATVNVTAQGSKGVATASGGTVTYRPNAGESGIDTVSYSVTARGATDTAEIIVIIKSEPDGANGAPSISLREYTDEEIFDAYWRQILGGHTLRFLVENSDPDGDDLTFVVSGIPQGARMIDNMFVWPTPVRQESDGNREYTATITAFDGTNGTASRDVRINVRADQITPPDPPEEPTPFANVDYFETFVNTSLTIPDSALGENDMPAGPVLSNVHDRKNVTITGLDTDSLTITPDDNFFGLAWFVVSLNFDDIHDDWYVANQLVIINVTGKEPVTLGEILQQNTSEGGAINYVIPADNPSHLDTTWSITSGQRGDADIDSEGRFTWNTTEADGADTPHEFGIRVEFDGNAVIGNMAEGTLAVMVAETNQAPVFDSNQTMHNATVGELFELDLNATDGDIPEQTVTYQITAQNTPENQPVTNNTNDLTREQSAPGNPAVINATTGLITWTPDTHGTKIITVQASDDHTPNGTASITLNITVPNTAPTAANATISINQSQTVSIDLAADGHINDAEQNAMTLAVSINDTPAQTLGEAAVNGTTITYDTREGATGIDRISYTVTDDGGLNATAVIMVMVNQTVFLVANNDDTAVIQNTARLIDVLDNDEIIPAGTPVNITVTRQGDRGLAAPAGGAIRYAPDQDAMGDDMVFYTISASGITSNEASINITIIESSANTPPTAENFTHDTPAIPGVPLEIPVRPRISDDEQSVRTLVVHVPVQPPQGTAVPENGTITYTADSDAGGNDTIPYVVIDNGGLNATGVITVMIRTDGTPKPLPQNNTAPTAENFTHDTAAVPGQPLEIPIIQRISDEQQPAETLNVTIPARPNQGNATYDNGTITYIADSGAVGNDTISYLVVDDGGLNATGIITVTISAQAPSPNTPPTAGGVIAMADTGETITINLAPHVDDDEDAAADLAVSITVQPTLGTASMTPGTQVIQYTAGQNAGTDTITYAVADSGGLNATGTINITISAVSTPAPNTPPTAESFTHGTPATPGRPLEIPITSRISDDAPLGDPPNVSISSQPNQGTATYAGGTITYTANAGATGTDTITYVVTDAGGLDATGTITVQIQPPRVTPGPVTPEPVQPEPGLGSTVPIRQCTR